MYLCIKLKKFMKICFISVLLLSVSTFFLFSSRISLPGIHAENEGICLPVIMYHKIIASSSCQNQWQISQEAFERDLKYLKDNGYETVNVQDLLDYINLDMPLPEKPVMITFDDGFYNNIVYALPLLEKYDMKAIISIVGEYTESYSESKVRSAAYSYCTWDDIREISQSGRFEIGNHTYGLHSKSLRNGSMKRSGESTEEYTKIFTDDVMKLQNTLTEKSNVTPIIFTYPFGAISKEAKPALIDMGFQATLNCYERPNYITKDPKCLFGLNRYNRSGGISTDKFMKKALSG